MAFIAGYILIALVVLVPFAHLFHKIDNYNDSEQQAKSDAVQSGIACGIFWPLSISVLIVAVFSWSAYKSCKMISPLIESGWNRFINVVIK